MAYKPLAKVRDTLRVEWYRCPIPGAQLRALSRRSDLQGWFQTLGHLVLFAGTGVLAAYLFVQQQWIGFACALFAHGTVTSFLGLAVHELGHGTVFRTKWLNKFFLRVYSLLAWHNFHDYAMSHTYHHRYTLHPEGDREVTLPKNPSLNVFYLLQLLTFNVTGGFESHGLIPILKKHVMTALGIFPGADAVNEAQTSSVFGEEWMEALYADCPEERKKAIHWSRLILLFHGGMIVLGGLLNFWLLPVLTTFSFFMANFWRYIVAVPMHCGLRDNVPDFRQCVRTITLDPLSTFLYWRMNWHTEHHMYAGVPCYRLKKLHQEIASDMPKPRTLIGAWREMRAIWRQQKIDPTYQFDTPLPASAGRVVSGDMEGLDASIGDLAPEILASQSDGGVNGDPKNAH
jgi:fatty acid desaturase